MACPSRQRSLQDTPLTRRSLQEHLEDAALASAWAARARSRCYASNADERLVTEAASVRPALRCTAHAAVLRSSQKQSTTQRLLRDGSRLAHGRQEHQVATRAGPRPARAQSTGPCSCSIDSCPAEFKSTASVHFGGSSCPPCKMHARATALGRQDSEGAIAGGFSADAKGDREEPRALLP
eukprot:6053993-Pleurochrysis_carterae.AAC.1